MDNSIVKIAYKWLINLSLVFLIFDFPIHLTLLYINLLQSSAKTSYSPAKALNQKGNFTYLCEKEGFIP